MPDTLPHRVPASPRHRHQMLGVTLGTVAMVAVVGFAAALGGGHVRRAAESQALVQADLAADAASQQSLGMLEVIESLIAQAQLAARLRQSGQDMGAMAVESELQRAVARSVIGVTRIGIVDDKGWLGWSSPPHAEPVYLGALPFMLAPRGAIQVRSGPLPNSEDQDGDRGTLHFARALTDEAGHFRGFAVVDVDPLILSARMARRELGANVDVRLVQLPQGQVVADSTASPGFLERRPMLGTAELNRLGAGAAGHALMLGIPGTRDRIIAFRRLLPAGALPAANPPGTQVVEASDSGLAVEVVLDAATELDSANRQRTMIFAAAASFTLICAAALASRVLLLRRRRARAVLAAAWRQVGAVKAVRAELEQLLVSLPVAVYQCRVGADGHYMRRYVSPMLAHMTGWPMHALADAAQWERKLEDGPPGRLTSFFASVLHDGEGMVEYRMRRPDGGWVWLRERARVAARVPDGGGEVIGTIADVSVEGELALQAAMTSKLAMLGEMASGMAHELNQPVTVIGLAADRGQDALNADPPDLKAMSRVLATIAAQAQRSGEIIDQLRLFGRGDTAPVGPVRLDQAMAGAMILAEGPLRDAHVTLRLHVPATLPPVLGRLVQVEQVIVNLCMNARDALLSRPEGARDLAITAEADGDIVRLRISDTGGGIPQEVMHRLFTPFVTSKPPGAGSGLGLSICQRLMRGCDGDIAARNANGGAVFTLTFRAAPEDAVAVAGPEQH